MLNATKERFTICGQKGPRYVCTFVQSDHDISCMRTESMDPPYYKTSLLKNSENFTTKTENFQTKNLIFFIFLFKT